MITRVFLAKLSPTMEEGTVVKWLKTEGDAVKQGDVLAEIETDKANMEMEALGTGVLRKILVGPGGKAPVGALIGVIAAPEDDISALLSQAPAPAEAAPASPPASPPPPAPRVERVAAAPPTPPAPTRVEPAPAAEPVEAASGERVKASPLARSMAAQQRIPLSLVKGSGPGGRIVKRDIEGFQPGRSPVAAPPPAARAGSEVPLSSMRRTIARRLTESVQTSPHFYVTVEIDMDAAAAVREQLLNGSQTKISYNDLVLKACAVALVRHPAVNASWGSESIRLHGDVHVGVAVSIPDGLITPVVRHADHKSVLEIASEVKELAARARDRKLKPEEFTGSTFTVSNLGMFDVTEFTAIINPPEGAILAVGAVRRVPVVRGEAILPGLRMRVTLSADHRLIDGALAARFLAEVRLLLENPVSLLF